MKQALLTEIDVKNFIDESINGNRTLNTIELMSYLDISRPMICEYIKRGVPYILKGKKKYFVLSKVKKFFIQMY